MSKWVLLLAVSLWIVTTVSLAGCRNGNASSPSSGEAPVATAQDPPLSKEPVNKEKVKPAPGTGNVQGVVLYNGKPAADIEVKLCETFSRFAGGPSGKSYAARTDALGQYVITNVPPMQYEALLVRVFDRDSFVFATTGIGLSSETYDVTADKTVFVQPTHLFKDDLKLVAPGAGAKVAGQDLELKWQPYPDAAFYRFSIHPEEITADAPYTNERVDGTSFRLDKPLAKGTYRWEVEAFNADDQKLSESSQDYKFTVKE